MVNATEFPDSVSALILGEEMIVLLNYVLITVIIMDFAKMGHVYAMMDFKENFVKSLYVKITAIIEEYAIKENVIA